MVDRVLPHKLQVPVRVPAIEPHPPFRQRHAQMVGIAVLELLHDPDFPVRSVAEVFLVPLVIHGLVILCVNLESVVHVHAPGRNICHIKEFNLLALMILKRRRPMQVVQMIIVEALLRNLLRHPRCAHQSDPSSAAHRSHNGSIRTHQLADVASHQLQRCVAKVSPAFVRHIHPTRHIQPLAGG